MTRRSATVFHREIGGGFVSKHRRALVRRDRFGRVHERVQFNATKSPPWITKPKRRAANRRARMSRKANR